jgi:flagellar biosynthetic protein FliP
MRWAAVLVLALLAFLGPLLAASPAAAQDLPDNIEPPPPTVPEVGDDDADPGAVDEDEPFTITVDGGGEGPSQSVIIIIVLTLLSLAPSIIIMLTSFTRIVVVLSLTRNALGLQGVPPNQVVVGLSLFLTLFVMGPTLNEINELALQPYLDGTIDQSEAYDLGTGPLREFMLTHTRTSELELMLDATDAERPEDQSDISLTTLIPAFLLSELKTAFLIGFVIFIPFLVIDMVVSAVLMSLGMMMLPPVFVSLPFKLLLFVMVGGWSLIVQTILTSFN